MKSLQVSIDQHSGFCFGVVYAIEMAEEILDAGQHLYCLGDIVHNDEEVNRLKNKGLRIIDHEALTALQDEKVLIRAHGEPASTYEMAMQNNLELVDASCPVVLKLQNRIKHTYDESVPVYIYGKPGHAEVKGLLAQTDSRATVFQDIGELDLPNMPSRIALYSQTTKSTDKFYEIVRRMREAGIEVYMHDTICRQVSNRDTELRAFVRNFDKIVFVAGTKSSNGRVLYEVCKNENPNTCFVSRPEELDDEWFNEGDRVGICGATSTPMWLMERIKKQLEAC